MHPLIDRFSSVPEMPALLLYLAAAAVPAILLHQLGHALVSFRRLGGPVNLSPGVTSTLVSIRIRRLRLHVSALSHAAEPASPASLAAVRASARDVMLVAVAGPAASLVCSALAACALSLTPGTGPAHDFLWASAATGLLGVLTVVPLVFQERPGGPRLRTDGRLVLDAVRAVRQLPAEAPRVLAPPEHDHAPAATPTTAHSWATAAGRGADTRAPRRSPERPSGMPSAR